MIFTPDDFVDPQNVLDDDGDNASIRKAWFQLVDKTHHGKTTLMFVDEGMDDTPRQWGLRIVTPKLAGTTVPTTHMYAQELIQKRFSGELYESYQSLESANWRHVEWARFE